MKYVIVRNDGLFVAKDGMLRSCTNKLQHARIFNSEAEAEAQKNVCILNENIKTLEEYLKGG